MKNCFRKRKLLGCAGALLATLLMLGGCASADMPPLPEHPGETEQQAPDNIGTQYEQSNVVMTGGRNLVNLPGIVLYTSQEDVGMHLSYANKSTGKAGVYCFDPLCNHSSCAVWRFTELSDITYSPTDGQLYGSSTIEDVESDGNLWRIDTQTQKVTQVYRGNGNPFKQLFAYGPYVYFTSYNQKGEWFCSRYHVEQGKTEQLSLPSSWNFRFIYPAGDYLMVTSASNSSIVYLCNDDFTEWKEVSLPTPTFTYSLVAGTVLYGGDYGEDTPAEYANANCSRLLAFDMLSGEVQIIYDDDTPKRVMAFDGAYLYYSQGEWSQKDSYFVGSMFGNLKRVQVGGATNNKQVEDVLDVTDYEGISSVQMAAIFEGTLYLRVKTSDLDYPLCRMTQDEEGKWQFHRYEILW